MKKIVLASGNLGKVKEFNQLFAAHFSTQAIEIVPQNSLQVIEVEETGLSFVEKCHPKGTQCLRKNRHGHPSR